MIGLLSREDTLQQRYGETREIERDFVGYGKNPIQVTWWVSGALPRPCSYRIRGEDHVD